MGLALRIVWGVVLLLAAGHLFAAPAPCDPERQALDAWNKDNGALETQIGQLDDALAGQPVAPAALTDALGAAADGPTPGRLSSSSATSSLGTPACGTLSAAYQHADQRRHHLNSRRRQGRQRWFALPRAQRQVLIDLDDLYQSRITGEDHAGDTDLLRRRLAAVLALTPLLRDAPVRAARQLDGLIAPAVDDGPAAEGAEQRLARLNGGGRALTVMLDLRASLWRRHALALLTAQTADGDLIALLNREIQLACGRVYQATVLTWRQWRLQGHLRHYLPLLSNALALLLGIAGFTVIWRLCRLARQALLRLHGRVVARAGERRWLWNVSHVLSSTAPLLPWLLLWLALDLVAPLLHDWPSTRVLLWLLPLARLYVVFGLLWLGGEWLVLRVAQGAGTYLNAEQTGALSERARHLAAWLMPPWALLLISDLLLGASLLHLITLVLVILATYAGLGRLLALRADDYRLCLETILPKKLDPLAGALLRPALFLWTAPLLLPVALVYFLGRYLDRLFSEFSGYLRLKARWFKLRAGGDDGGEERADQDDGQAAQAYQRWFGAHLPDDGDAPGRETPFIDTGLLDAMGKSVSLWLDDKSDENTLLVNGEKGCGKSMTMARLTASLAGNDPDLRVVSVNVPPKTVTPEAVTALIAEALGEDLTGGPASLVKGDGQRPSTLLVLDEAQNFFLSQIGGLDGWRTLLGLTNARLNNLFWLVLLNNQSWGYLCNVFGRDYQFRNVVRVKPWSQSEIRSLVLSRHHLSDQQLRYDDILLSSRGPDAGNVRNAEQRYFSLLWDACRGNPMAALRLWLSSVKVSPREVRVGLPKMPAGSVVEKAGENLMFVYAAIAIHENLASGEIATVTNLPENVVRYAIKAGSDGGFLHQSEEDGRYRLVPLWYHTVIHYLLRKNLLHE